MFVRFTIDVLGVQYCQIKTDPNITRGWGPKTRSGLINIMIIRIDQSKHKSFDWKISSEWIQKSARPRERVKLNRQTYWIFRFISDLCVAATLFIICNWFLYPFHAFSTDSEQAFMKKIIQWRTGSVHVLQMSLRRFYTQNGIMSDCWLILIYWS